MLIMYRNTRYLLDISLFDSRHLSLASRFPVYLALSFGLRCPFSDFVPPSVGRRFPLFRSSLSAISVIGRKVTTFF